MTQECPVCGFNPEANSFPQDLETLRKRRIENIFNMHLARSWWIAQPEFICGKLKEMGLQPTNILDAGCGDGRWVPGVTQAWPEARYTGIDKIPSHYDMNLERMPEHRWFLGDITEWNTDERFDLAIIGGTLNPAMGEQPQTRFLNTIVHLGSRHIVCLFDRNVSGEPPDRWIEHAYKKTAELDVPSELCGPRQHITVWLYEKMATHQ